MEVILWTLLLTPFFYFNYKIIKIDITDKRVPNLHLCYLLYFLPVWYLYIHYIWILESISLVFLVWQVLITFMLSFLLFYFKIWGAWESKYFFILSLYLPHISFLVLFTNIFFVFVMWLLMNYMFQIMQLWVKKEKQSLFKNRIDEIIQDLKKFFQKLTIFKVISYIITFLWFFIVFRLIRIFLLEQVNFREILISIQKDIFLKISLIISIIVVWWIGIKILPLLKNILPNPITRVIIFCITVFVFILFIKFDTLWTLEGIKKILIFYIAIYILAKILFFIYKEVYKMQEYYFLHSNNIKFWTILDSKYITQYKIKYLDVDYIKSKWIKIPKELIKKIKSSYFLKDISKKNYTIATSEDVNKLCSELKVIEEIVSLYKTNKSDIEETHKLKAVKSLHFSSNIFLWFLLSLAYFSITKILFIYFL